MHRRLDDGASARLPSREQNRDKDRWVTSTTKTPTERANARPQASAFKKPLQSPGAKEGLSLHDFQMMLRAEVRLPVDAHVIGEPVSVTAIHDPGVSRVGLMARCLRSARVYDVNLADIVFAPTSPAASLVARYRMVGAAFVVEQHRIRG